jgi:murein DD-endopeptidase MepM/ murein hydrolase activator NlpD
LISRARIPLVASALGASLVFGSAGGAAPPSPRPTASAKAVAISISIPNQAGASTQVVTAPPRAQGFLDGFRYPADGSAVGTGAVSVSATVASGSAAAATATAQATTDVASLALFGGEVTADGIAGRAHASAGGKAARGDVTGSGVTNLVVLGQPVTASPGLRVALADWGYVVVLAQGADTAAPASRKANRSFVIPLDVHLTADHGGLPAGTVIQVGYAEAAGVTAPPPPSPQPKPKPLPKPGPSTAGHDERANVRSNKGIPLKILAHRGPLGFQPKLTAGGYVFPVYGAVSYGDTFGAARGDVSGGWHHGDDIFGQVGQPILAVADGTLFDVGRIKIGGNRLWLRDRQGNQFYYAHLSAYSAAARNGAGVKAGAVIGFMGTTGDALGTPAHLHFEVHPVSLLFLGYDGAVNPTAYLDAWSRQEDLKFPSIAGWAPSIRGSVRAPQPGAILLGSSDISSADGLDPASLQRALRAPARPGGEGAFATRATPPARRP